MVSGTAGGRACVAYHAWQRVTPRGLIINSPFVRYNLNRPEFLHWRLTMIERAFCSDRKGRLEKVLCWLPSRLDCAGEHHWESRSRKI